MQLPRWVWTGWWLLGATVGFYPGLAIAALIVAFSDYFHDSSHIPEAVTFCYLGACLGACFSGSLGVRLFQHIQRVRWITLTFAAGGFLCSLLLVFAPQYWLVTFVAELLNPSGSFFPMSD
jgi:hypothetical protein